MNSAKQALLEMVDIEHAVVQMEARAKACDVPWDDYPRFDPDILNSARDELVEEGRLRVYTRPTRGSRPIAVLGMPDLNSRRTDFEKAAARKRALQARYLSWTLGNARYPQGQIGPAAEAVVRASLIQAREKGAPYTLVAEGRGVSALFGEPIEGGPIDHAAFLMAMSEERPTAVTVVIEVKNVRSWIYPNARELFQLLHKAARLQEKNPSQAILPVLVCRRLHWSAGLMAKELGFFLTELRTQYIKPSVLARLVDEVRNELGYVDLVRTTRRDEALVDRLRFTIPREAARLASRWSEMGSQFGDIYQRLRGEEDRSGHMSDLYEAVRGADLWSSTWPLEPHHLGF